MHTSVRRITYAVSAAIIALAAYLSQLALDDAADACRSVPAACQGSGGKPGEPPKD